VNVDDHGRDSEFVRTLRGLGVREEDIAAAREAGLLPLLAVEALALTDLRYDVDELAARAGLDVERICTMFVALGFPAPQPGERLFNDTDVARFREVADLIDSHIADPEVVIQMTRVLGSSLARIANALVELIATRREAGELALSEGAKWFGDAFGDVLVQVWRRHLQLAARARLTGQLHSDPFDETAPQTIGFADLVGFTALSQQLDSASLAAVVDRFEAVAFSTIATHGGRVVKMIGDEVMFAIEDPVEAARCALDLAESYHEADDLSDVRVGLAHGVAIDRDGDLYGPPVNLASRITAIAYPGTVVIDDAVNSALAEHPDEFVVRPMLPRRLKNIGLVRLHVLRRAGETGGRAERRLRRRARVTELLGNAMTSGSDVVDAISGAVTADEERAADDEVGPPPSG
jgi:adenylate cyclase